MNAYKALIAIDIKLALRQRSVIFFNYLFPLIFFFIFGQAMHAERGAAMTIVIAMVLIIGILGNGLFGAGIRAVQEREANILRRYKVTPITPAPLLIASAVTGWILYMPNVILIFTLAHFMYGMPWPQSMGSIIIFISIAIIGFRAIGLIIASVVNSTQESQLVVQLIYLPMLFLSGATFPLSMFPPWLLVVTQFVPATYMVTGIQGMLLRNEGLSANILPTLALALTAAVGLFIGYNLFRWEKEEKIRSSAKLLLLAVLMPFLLLGAWQMHSRTGIVKTKILNRELARSDTFLIRGARIFVGDGKVIENGSVLVRGGKIAEVYADEGPDPKTLKAETVEAAGKTILPGLIDVHVHLGAPGGFYSDTSNLNAEKMMTRNLTAYLYSGVTTVRSVGDALNTALKIRSMVNSGEVLASDLSTCGPLFTAPGGHGTEYFKGLPASARTNVEAQFIRTPGSAEEARQQVDALNKDKVDCIKAILEAGAGGRVFNRLDTNLFDAVAQEAHADSLPLAVHTGDARDVADAVSAQANSIEHGSFREKIPDVLFEQMAKQGIFYDPTLSVGEAFKDLAAGNTDLLKRSLVQQVGPPELLHDTEEAIHSSKTEELRKSLSTYPIDMQIAIDNLKLAWGHGVSLVTGSDAGNYLVIHGPTVQHELELWVKAGIPPAVALQAATLNAARLLRADNHIGSIRPGNDADLLVIDGNPLEDITATERISLVVFKGERVDRSELFDQH
ncbi:MAG TPA: amidohydrolase family protein [Candidatus Aquilonibacter sp.]|jgi:imidazolonepropionase-like amidohydrolase/ABC-type multidrug transport system permease subunit|nr:amidohydrolase family protein [Candidatus Aquilonibacter sp.]